MHNLLAERLALPAIGEPHQRDRVVLAAQELGRDAEAGNPQAVAGPDVHADPAAEVLDRVALFVLTPPDTLPDHGRTLVFQDRLVAMRAFVPGGFLLLDDRGLALAVAVFDLLPFQIR